VGFFDNISSGIVDMFYEPYQGFVSDRPQDIGIGIAKVPFFCNDNTYLIVSLGHA
jgi:hypothetical protein